ncbi:RING-H2 finger protein ATL3, partial [Mucuna pruriens]
MANLNPTSLVISLNSTRGTMATILTFLTAIAFVAQSFQNYMIQRLQKLYKHYGYAASVKDNEEHESDYCSVCLSHISKGEKVRSLPVCNHRYHADCIGVWLKNHTTCPLCRNNITDHVPPKHKHVKNFGEAMFNLMQSFTDLLVALLYMPVQPGV